MVLYHITKGRNLARILRNGLIPNHRVGLSKQSLKNRVYLTNDVDRIVRTQAGIDWVKRNKAIVLAVEVDSCDPVQYRCHGTYALSDFEFTVAGRIPPERISFSHVIEWAVGIDG